MAESTDFTPFTDVYTNFLSKITDDMFMELTIEDTYKILYQLLFSAISYFQFPKIGLEYEVKQEQDAEGNVIQYLAFNNKLNNDQINILATYMVAEWIGQQLASVENVRMKYSGADFKFTSQANHIQKLTQLKKEYLQQGFHLQRLYKRRYKGEDGAYHSTFGKIMQKPKHTPPKRNKKQIQLSPQVLKAINDAVVAKYMDTISQNSNTQGQGG